MNVIDIINKKREGYELTNEEIGYFVNGYTRGEIADYQASALLMAICLNGMTAEETTALALYIRDSGDTVDLSEIDGIKIDKHSTGGVGDKTTLVVAPIVAAAGVKLAKMSGRGLGHTGGTLDKLESIKGFSTVIEREKFIKTVNSIGLSVIGQSGNLAPADKKLYALRDVTGTVSSIPLIASSIMGKKLASGADRIVLDVKTGSGAFMKTVEEAVSLGKTMVDIGAMAGKATSALVTDMESPLGCAIGNALEVEEAINTLKGKGEERFLTLCLHLAAEMLTFAGKGNREECFDTARKMVESGKALTAFRMMVIAQGGDPSCIDDGSKLPKASVIKPFTAKKEGFVSVQNALCYGKAACALGAGRLRKEDGVDHAAGICLAKKVGDLVKEGDVIAYLHTNSEKTLADAEKLLEEGTVLSDTAPAMQSIVIARINENGETQWIN